MLSGYSKTLHELSTEKIIDIINNEYNDYTQEFIQCAGNELENRGVPISKDLIDKRIKEITRNQINTYKTYSSLRKISVIFKVIAWLALAAGIAAAALCIEKNRSALVILAQIAGSGIAFVINYTIAEMILLFIDVADNSSRTNNILEKYLDSSK